MEFYITVNYFYLPWQCKHEWRKYAVSQEIHPGKSKIEIIIIIGSPLWFRVRQKPCLEDGFMMYWLII